MPLRIQHLLAEATHLSGISGGLTAKRGVDAAWLHYGLSNTLSQIVEVFSFHFQMKITSGVGCGGSGFGNMGGAGSGFGDSSGIGSGTGFGSGGEGTVGAN